MQVVVVEVEVVEVDHHPVTRHSPTHPPLRQEAKTRHLPPKPKQLNLRRQSQIQQQSCYYRFPLMTSPSTHSRTFQPQKRYQFFELKKPLEVSNQRLVTLIAGTNKKDKIIGSVSGEIIAGGEGKDVISGGGGADGFLFQDPDGFGKKEADKIQDFNADEGDSILIDNQAFNLNRKVKFKATAGKNAIKKGIKIKKKFYLQ